MDYASRQTEEIYKLRNDRTNSIPFVEKDKLALTTSGDQGDGLDFMMAKLSNTIDEILSPYALDTLVIPHISSDGTLLVERLLEHPRIREITTDFDLVTQILSSRVNYNSEDKKLKIFDKTERTTLVLRDLPNDFLENDVKNLFGDYQKELKFIEKTGLSVWFATFTSGDVTSQAFNYVRNVTIDGRHIGVRFKSDNLYKSPCENFYFKYKVLRNSDNNLERVEWPTYNFNSYFPVMYYYQPLVSLQEKTAEYRSDVNVKKLSSPHRGAYKNHSQFHEKSRHFTRQHNQFNTIQKDKNLAYNTAESYREKKSESKGYGRPSSSSHFPSLSSSRQQETASRSPSCNRARQRSPFGADSKELSHDEQKVALLSEKMAELEVSNPKPAASQNRKADAFKVSSDNFLQKKSIIPTESKRSSNRNSSAGADKEFDDEHKKQQKKTWADLVRNSKNTDAVK